MRFSSRIVAQPVCFFAMAERLTGNSKSFPPRPKDND
jgi:hypothetical protein